MRKLSFEQMMGEAVEQYAFTAHEKYRQKHLADAQARGATPKELSLVRQEPEMADWSDLDESTRRATAPRSAIWGSGWSLST